MTTNKTSEGKWQEEITKKLDEIAREQKGFADAQRQIQITLAERSYLDEHVKTIVGNGKPGFVSIRDKVMAWETKGNAITLLIVGDILMRILQLTVFK